MKFLGFLLLITQSLFAIEYYSKLEPINNYVVKAAVSGQVVYTNDKIEGTKVQKPTVIVQLDSRVDKVELEQTKEKLAVINSMLEIEQNNYERLKKVSSKSAFEKDNQKVKALNLQSSRADLLIKMATLQDKIRNKNLNEKSLYIYDIAVKKGDYVNPGTLLYEAKDLSKGKLEIFIPIADVKAVKTKAVYIDGKKSDAKISKIYEVADAKHISSYKCEIIIDNPKIFSRLVKVEFK